MFNARIFSLSVFTNENSIDVVIWGLETFDRYAGSNIRKQVKRPPQCQVEGDVALSN